MSVHVSPPFPDHAPGAGAESVVAEPQDRAAFAAGWSGRIPAAPREPPTDDVLWVRLPHIGVAIALSAVDPMTPSEKTPRALEDTARQTIHFLLNAEAHLPSLRPLLGPACDASGARPATEADDPVIMRLSNALEAAERSEDGFAGVYADALRLAVVTRVVSLREHVMRAPAAAPAQERRSRPNSGLLKWRLKRVMEFVDAHLHRPVTLADMASAAGLSRMHFAAQFRVATGLRAHEYLLKRRIERAQTLLLETREPLAQIALTVGFQTQAHFTTVFRRFVGDTPHQWRCARTM